MIVTSRAVPNSEYSRVPCGIVLPLESHIRATKATDIAIAVNNRIVYGLRN